VQRSRDDSPQLGVWCRYAFRLSKTRPIGCGKEAALPTSVEVSPDPRIVIPKMRARCGELHRGRTNPVGYVLPIHPGMRRHGEWHGSAKMAIAARPTVSPPPEISAIGLRFRWLAAVDPPSDYPHVNRISNTRAARLPTVCELASCLRITESSRFSANDTQTAATLVAPEIAGSCEPP